MGTMTAGAIVAASTGHAATLPEPVANTATVQVPVAVELAEPQITSVTVEKGNTLSGIAAEYCANSADASGIYVKNEKTIGNNWNLIQPKQVLVLDCQVASLPVATTSYVRTTHYVARTTYQAPSGYSGNVDPASYSGIQQCIITRESGGRAQVMNSSGHYGLYQFDYGTWVSGGGAAGDFGRASVAEQNRVFANVYAARGAEPWAPSDGC